MSARSRGVLRPLVVLPTGAGKSLLMAAIAREYLNAGKRVMIAAHVKELLEQNAGACRSLGIEPGIFSAGLDKQETEQDCVIGGIQSIYGKAASFGSRAALIVDEAHRIGHDSDSMYHQFLDGLRAANQQVELVGLTATPYRTGEGLLTEGDPALFDEIVYEAKVDRLIADGFLSPLRTKATGKPNLAGIKRVAGDYAEGQLAAAMMPLVPTTVRNMMDRASDCKQVLVFGVNLEHCAAIAAELESAGHMVPVVSGSTPADQRAHIVRAFKAGEFKYLVNCQVFTTGFDVPALDCVAIVRPTCSPGLYYQMVGRALRKAPGKDSALILDYGGNIGRHGPINDIDPGAQPKVQRECPRCQTVIPAGTAVCPDCGYIFSIERKAEKPQERELTHDFTPSDADIVGRRQAVAYSVIQWRWMLHVSRAGLPTLMVSYITDLGSTVREWVCFEHDGYARMKAKEWWMRHGANDPPSTIALAMSRMKELRRPRVILVEKDGKYDRVTKRMF
jgi:DNA repair protein RadD